MPCNPRRRSHDDRDGAHDGGSRDRTPAHGLGRNRVAERRGRLGELLGDAVGLGASPCLEALFEQIGVEPVSVMSPAYEYRTEASSNEAVYKEVISR